MTDAQMTYIADLKANAKVRISKSAFSFDFWRREMRPLGRRIFTTAAQFSELTADEIAEYSVVLDGEKIVSALHAMIDGKTGTPSEVINWLKNGKTFEEFEIANKYQDFIK